MQALREREREEQACLAPMERCRQRDVFSAVGYDEDSRRLRS